MRRAYVTLWAVLLFSASSATAEPYPSRVIRIIVPTSAGGTTDLIARMLAHHIAAKSGGQAVVDNRPGANGNVGMDVVAKSPPDGYTLGFANTGHIVINPFLYKVMSYNPLKELVPIGLVGEAPQLLVVNKALPAKTLQDFITLAKSKPGELNYGSAGPGSTPHLAGDQFSRLAGLNLVHVPYRGTAPAVTDLVRENVQMISISLGPVAGFVESGALRVLATATKRRMGFLPEVPTSAEAGVPGYEMATWFGLFAPAGTPKEIIQALNGWIEGLLETPDARKRLADNAVEQQTMSVDEFGRFIATEAVKWERVVRDSGVSMQ
jgi:tripartite-type tricarboxylate transporter receptor subunit TctC